MVDHNAGQVIWASEGRGAAAVEAFFGALGPERLTELEVVTADMAARHLKAIREEAPHAPPGVSRPERRGEAEAPAGA